MAPRTSEAIRKPLPPPGTPDESVVVPKHVKDAAARAEALHKMAYPDGQQPGSEPRTLPPVVPASQLVSETPPEPQPAPPQEAPVQPAPAPEPPPQTGTQLPAEPPAPVQTVEELRAALDQSQRQYQSMLGRFNQSQDMLRTLQGQIAELGNEVIRLQQTSQAPAMMPSRQQQRRLLTDKDQTDYGPELIDFAQRAAREALAPELERLESENRSLRVAQQQTQRTSIEQALDASVPNWREVYTNPAFAQWLSLPDVYSNAVRSELLRDAANKGHSARVVAIYQGFLAHEAATSQPLQPPPGREPQASRPPALNATQLAAPGRGNPAPSMVNPGSTVSDKPIFTRAQVDQFYTDVRRGVYRGREQQKEADERAIHAAIVEGRVQ